MTENTSCPEPSSSGQEPPVHRDFVSTLERKAQLRARAGLSRTLTYRNADDPVIDLAGNDYLGLAKHPKVIEAAAKALHDYGLGATGSRLVRGSTDEHSALERDLATLMGWEHTLVYSSGYLANLGALRALARPHSVFVLDAHAHASLIDGCRLTGARTATAPHNDLAAFSALLTEHGANAVVVVESVYSVDGDLAPLPQLHALCRRHGALLLVDDAHGLGVLGNHGAGGVHAAGLSAKPDVIVTATLSKAVGAAGGVVAAHPSIIKHLIDTSRTFLYDTALPPSVVAGARAALGLVQEGDEQRTTLHHRAQLAHDTLTRAGLEVSIPSAGVISVRADSAETALSWTHTCLKQGIAIGCFRPPSTPDNRSRLRLTINAGIAETDFTHALNIIAATTPRNHSNLNLHFMPN